MISPYSLTIPGGVQGQILGLARAMRAQGEDVRVLGPCDGPPPANFVTPLGNSVPTGANGSVAPIAPDPAAQLRTIRALRDEKFDLLHLHEPMAPGPTMTALLIKPAPVVATFHAAGSSLAYEIFKPFTSRGSKRIDRRFAVSEAARELAHAALGGEYEISFNAVDVRGFDQAGDVSTEGPTILFVARHEERKGLDVLLEAFAALPSNHRLWIAGTGEQTGALKHTYGSDQRIAWLGEIDEAEKMARMRSADVFCAPSLHGESFGIVLLEAMAARTLVVASDLEGYSKVSRGGQDAVLVPPGDVGSLSHALMKALEDAEASQMRIRSGRERVAQFSMVALAEIYLRCYEDLVPES